MKKLFILTFLLASFCGNAQIRETIVRMKTDTALFLEKYYPEQLIRLYGDSTIYALKHATQIGQSMRTASDSGWLRVFGSNLTEVNTRDTLVKQGIRQEYLDHDVAKQNVSDTNTVDATRKWVLDKDYPPFDSLAFRHTASGFTELKYTDDTVKIGCSKIYGDAHNYSGWIIGAYHNGIGAVIRNKRNTQNNDFVLYNDSANTVVGGEKEIYFATGGHHRWRLDIDKIYPDSTNKYDIGSEDTLVKRIFSDSALINILNVPKKLQVGDSITIGGIKIYKVGSYITMSQLFVTGASRIDGEVELKSYLRYNGPGITYENKAGNSNIPFITIDETGSEAIANITGVGSITANSATIGGQPVLRTYKTWGMNPQTIVCIGTSITAQDIQTSDTTMYLPSYGYFNQANAAMGMPFKILNHAGIGANTLLQMEARLATDVIAYSPGYCLIEGGLNDINAGASLDTLKNRITRLTNHLKDHNIISIVCTTTPYGSWTFDKARIYFEFNSWLREWSRINNYVLIDFEKEIIRRNAGNWEWLSGYTGDGIHPNNTGAYNMALEIYNVLNSKVVKHSLLSISPIDTLLNVNHRLLGSGGTISGTNVTGVAPDEWTLSTDGDDAVVGARETVGKYDLFKMTFTYATSADSVYLYESATPSLSSGDTIYGVSYFKVDPAVTGYKNICLMAYVKNVGGDTVYTASSLYNAVSTEQDGYFSEYTLETPDIIWSAGYVSVTLCLIMQLKSGVIRVQNIELKQR